MTGLKSSGSVLFLLMFAAPVAWAQKSIPPLDLWNDQIMVEIRDRSTLDSSIEPNFGYADVFFTSTSAANFFDSKSPYAEHKGEKIRIHGYLAYPYFGGPHPALVIGHGHKGKADLSFAQLLASQGYVTLAIDGPQSGKSTGGPTDDPAGWISVDSGAQYSYLYHYAYAGMRALTLLEDLAQQPGNPYRIDATQLGAVGVSMGGFLATYMNGVDSRMKAAIVIAAAGAWHSTLRYPNSWLYHDLYTGTRDLPYNGADPVNSIEDIDFDPTAVTFFNYFDPIRYAQRQRAPVLMLQGTHDQYFPLTNANLTQLAVRSAGTQTRFEKRLWLLPNATHGTFTAVNILSLSTGLRQWLDYCFGKRTDRPLATPQIQMTVATAGLQLAVTTTEPTARLAGVTVEIHAATRVNSTPATIKDFTTYPAIRFGNSFFVTLAPDEKSGSGDVYTADNIGYYATMTDSRGLAVSSLVYSAGRLLDLSSGLVPAIEHSPEDTIAVPVPPDPIDAVRTTASSIALTASGAYQGMALSNPTTNSMALRIEARTPEGRIASADGLINPVFITIPPQAQQQFLLDQWLGPGARQINGSFQIGWNDKRGTSLAFRGNFAPADLDAIGPLPTAGKSLWLPMIPEQDRTTVRRVRFFSGSTTEATVTVTGRGRLGDILDSGEVKVPAWGSVELPIPIVVAGGEIASIQIEASVPVAVRAEVRTSRDSWSVDAVPASQATTFRQPHVEWNGQYLTRLVVMNTSPTASRIIRFRRRTPDGGLVGSEVTLTVDKNQSITITLEMLFRIASTEVRGAGWLDADTQGGDVLIFAMATDIRTGSTAVSQLGSGETGTLSMPYFVESTGYFTGLSLANTASTQASIRIVAYDSEGAELARIDTTLGASQSKTQLVSQWLPGLPANTSGRIVITVSAPLALLAYFGTDNGASLAAIPFTPLQP